MLLRQRPLKIVRQMMAIQPSKILRMIRQNHILDCRPILQETNKS